MVICLRNVTAVTFRLVFYNTRTIIMFTWLHHMFRLEDGNNQANWQSQFENHLISQSGGADVELYILHTLWHEWWSCNVAVSDSSWGSVSVSHV